MDIARRRLRAFAWLALAAMWALALLPTLAHARAFGAGAGTHWAEVCTPQGVRWVAMADVAPAAGPEDTAAAQPAGAPVSAAGHLEHCPWCTPVHVDLALLPAGPGKLPAAPSGARAAPLAEGAPPHAAPPWPAALARAPPRA